MKIKALFIPGIAFLLFHAVAQAQDSLSLRSALDFAVKHRNEIKIQETNAQISENEISKVKSRFLPTLAASLDSRYNGKLATQIIPGDAFGAPGSPSRKVAFGSTYSTSGGLDLSIPIYNPGDRSDKQIAEVQAAYDRLAVKKTEVDITVKVYQSYFNLLISQEKMKLAGINSENARELYTVSIDQKEKGDITDYDLEKARVNFENEKSDYEQTLNSYGLATQDLAYRIGLRADSTITPVESLTGIFQEFSSDLSMTTQNERVEVMQAKQMTEVSKANIKKQQLSYWPTISAYGSLAAQNLDNSYSLFQGGNWYPYNYLGVKVSFSIFDGFAKKRTKHGYELQLKADEFSLEKTQRDVAYQVESAKTTVLNDQKAIASQDNNVKKAKELYDIDLDKLKQGEIKPTDLTNTRYLLLQAQNLYLNAVYAFLMDMVQYKKASAIL